jgi:hypothetical protein
MSFRPETSNVTMPFQGQEAAVVLVSMATSAAEDIPRGVGFLFSRERLNVAVSRARCLAVVLASPKLLEVPCASIEDLRLVNTLCHVHAWGAAQTQGDGQDARRTSSRLAFQTVS